MYSPRPGTLSARWEDDIPHEEKQRRHQAVEKQQEAICTARNANHLGAALEVLVDSKAKGRWGGRSRGNQLVHFEDDRDLLGQLVDVKINEIKSLVSHGRSHWSTPLNRGIHTPDPGKWKRADVQPYRTGNTQAVD